MEGTMVLGLFLNCISTLAPSGRLHHLTAFKKKKIQFPLQAHITSKLLFIKREGSFNALEFI